LISSQQELDTRESEKSTKFFVVHSEVNPLTKCNISSAKRQSVSKKANGLQERASFFLKSKMHVGDRGH
jgi:hypothetical protein